MAYEDGDLDDGNDLMYALTWRDAEDRPMYWSVYNGWVFDASKAWTLTLHEVESINQDDALEGKLPQKKEAKEGAEWQPIYRRFPLYARGVSGEDDPELDDEPVITRLSNSTGERYG